MPKVGVPQTQPLGSTACKKCKRSDALRELTIHSLLDCKRHSSYHAANQPIQQI